MMDAKPVFEIYKKFIKLAHCYVAHLLHNLRNTWLYMNKNVHRFWKRLLSPVHMINYLGAYLYHKIDIIAQKFMNDSFYSTECVQNQASKSWTVGQQPFSEQISHCNTIEQSLFITFFNTEKFNRSVQKTTLM